MFFCLLRFLSLFCVTLAMISCKQQTPLNLSTTLSRDDNNGFTDDNQISHIISNDNEDGIITSTISDLDCFAHICNQPPNSCYKDFGICRKGKCEYLFDNPKHCDDKNDCTIDDTCIQGSCIGKAIICDQTKPCYEQGICQNGYCVYQPKKNGESCQQDDPCIISSHCRDGKCVAKKNKICNQPQNQCFSTQGKCNFQGQCEYERENHKPCDDQNSCTTYDRCIDGECFGEMLDCDTSTQTICLDSMTSQTTFFTGLCIDNIGSCEQIIQTDLCAFGCNATSGLCKSDPCLSIICNQPKNSCFDGFGSCIDGNCVYQPNDNLSCDDNDICTDNICNNGQCITTKIECDQSLLPHCSDTQHFTTYHQNGNCDHKLGCIYAIDKVYQCENGCSQDICYPKTIKTLVIASENAKYPSKLTLDDSDNIIIAGKFFNEIDFDPESTVDFHISNGNQDVFISKYSANGNYLWTKTFGGLYKDHVYDLITHSQDNIIIAGSFQGEVDFDPSQSQELRFGDTLYGDEFLLWLDSNGNFVDVKVWNDLYMAPITKLARDSHDNVFMSGEFFYSFDFDFTSNIDRKNVPLAGGYLVKILANKDYSWSYIFAGNSDIDNFQPSLRVDDMTIDHNDNILIVGTYTPNAIFQEPIPAQITQKQPQENRLYLLKISNDKNLLWSRSFEHGNYNIDEKARNYHLSNIAISADDDIIISRMFSGIIDFDLDVNSQDYHFASLTSTITPGIAIIKLDANANYLKTKTFEVGKAYYHQPSLSLDMNQKIFIASTFQNHAVFDFQKQIAIDTFGLSDTDLDAFYMQMDYAFSVDYTRIIAGNDWQSITDLEITSQNSLILYGFFSNTVDFGYEFSDMKTSSDNADIFIQIIDLNL